MQFTTFVLAALASVASAAPQRRAVQTVGLPNPNFAISKNPAAGTNVASTQAFPVNLPASECTLFWQFQPGFPVAQQGATQINVFDVDGNAPGALVGTFTIDRFDGQPHDINTFACRNPLTVRFEIAADAGTPGSVSFHADAWNGIFLEFTEQ